MRSVPIAIRRWRWTEFQLLIVPAVLSLVGMLIVIVVPTGNLAFTWRDLWMSLLFIALLARHALCPGRHPAAGRPGVAARGRRA